MKKFVSVLSLACIPFLLSSCSLKCINGHTWKEATCETPKICLVCGKTEGERLSPTGTHTWQPATCTEPETCSICGEKKGNALGHEWNEIGECTRCGGHKEYENSYGYFSAFDLNDMAKDAIQNIVYPIYVSNFKVYPTKIEKITDLRMDVGLDCFAVASSAYFHNNGKTEEKNFAVIIEPRTNGKYVCKDYLIL